MSRGEDGGPQPWPLWLAVGTLVFALLDVGHAAGLFTSSWLDPDREGTFPAAFSALLLAYAAMLARSLEIATAARGRRVWRIMSIVFACMAIDEVLTIHEKLERSIGIDWQVLYLPLILGGAGAGLYIVHLLRRDRLACGAWAAGGAAWAASQWLEKLQWSGDVQVAGYVPMMVGEEILEMAGSLLLGIGMIVAHRAAVAGVRARPDGSAVPAE